MQVEVARLQEGVMKRALWNEGDIKELVAKKASNVERKAAWNKWQQIELVIKCLGRLVQ